MRSFQSILRSLEQKTFLLSIALWLRGPWVMSTQRELIPQRRATKDHAIEKKSLDMNLCDLFVKKHFPSSKIISIMPIIKAYLGKAYVGLGYSFNLIKSSFEDPDHESQKYTFNCQTLVHVGDENIMAIFRTEEHPLQILNLKNGVFYPYKVGMNQWRRDPPTTLAYVKGKQHCLMIGSKQGHSIT